MSSTTFNLECFPGQNKDCHNGSYLKTVLHLSVSMVYSANVQLCGIKAAVDFVQRLRSRTAALT